MSERCTNCNADFDGGPIPEDIRQHYLPPYRFSRRIGIVDPERDCVVAHRCPDCGFSWSEGKAA